MSMSILKRYDLCELELQSISVADAYCHIDFLTLKAVCQCNYINTDNMEYKM